MSRSGYGDGNQWELIKWRGAVASAMRGRRGQAFLKEMLAALDTIPTKQLISRDLSNLQGVCALGAVACRRQVDVSELDPEDHKAVAAVFDVAHAMACEIMFENDEGAGYWREETPEQRWDRVRRWVLSNIKEGAK